MKLEVFYEPLSWRLNRNKTRIHCAIWNTRKYDSVHYLELNTIQEWVSLISNMKAHKGLVFLYLLINKSLGQLPEFCLFIQKPVNIRSKMANKLTGCGTDDQRNANLHRNRSSWRKCRGAEIIYSCLLRGDQTQTEPQATFSLFSHSFEWNFYMSSICVVAVSILNFEGINRKKITQVFRANFRNQNHINCWERKERENLKVNLTSETPHIWWLLRNGRHCWGNLLNGQVAALAAQLQTIFTLQIACFFRQHLYLG